MVVGKVVWESWCGGEVGMSGVSGMLGERYRREGVSVKL